MKIEHLLFTGTLVILVGFVLADRLVLAQFEPAFKKLETQRIITSNKLASAKIVYENLNHVRDLVQKNMIFPGQKDSVSHETIFFDFITTCVNDLKMKLISCRPNMPVVEGATTKYSYDIELECNFFTLGELCAKFENSRRIISIGTFDVNLSGNESVTGNKGIAVRMHINTYRIRKG